MKNRVQKQTYLPQTSKSLNQLSNKKPLILPQVKKKRYFMYDNISVSPQHIRISSSQNQKSDYEKSLISGLSSRPTITNRNLSPKYSHRDIIRNITKYQNSIINHKTKNIMNLNSNQYLYVKNRNQQKLINGNNRYSFDIDEILKSNIFDEDRVIQKQNQYNQEYNKMKSRLRWKAEQKRAQKGDLSIIYDKFIKLL